MSQRIDHVGIAVRSLERSLPFWREALGLEPAGVETVAAEQVRVALLALGDSRVELLEPTSPESPVARSIAKRGEGLHHLTLAVPDLTASLARLERHGATILGGGARGGAGGRRIAFIHPKSAGGVLVELVQAPAAAPEFSPGSSVLLYLREPQEKLWGVLRRMDATGIVIEALDLASFDAWTGQVVAGDPAPVGPSTLFVPLLRVERVALDEASGELPSLAERFARRTGRSVQSVLRERGG